MTEQKGLLCIFTRAPVSGQVKTRLLPVLGESKTTALYLRLLENTLQRASQASIAEIRLYCWPDSSHPVLRDYAQRFAITLHNQRGPDLGARMSAALDEGLQDHDYALVVGCDCADLRSADLDEAGKLLSAGTEVVLGPARDGGYYLLGLRRLQTCLFDNMHWGQSTVLSETRQRLLTAGIEWAEISERTDIDDAEDLALLGPSWIK